VLGLAGGAPGGKPPRIADSSAADAASGVTRDELLAMASYREEACAQPVYATNSLPRKSKKPSRGAPPACGLAAATQWTPGEGRGRRKRSPPAKTGSDEPRCT